MGKGNSPLLTLFCLSLLFHFFFRAHSASSESSKEGVGRHLKKKSKISFHLVFCVLLCLRLSVELSWLSLAGYYVLKFTVEPPEGGLLATSVMGTDSVYNVLGML